MNSHWYYIEILAGFFWISIVISLKFLLDFQWISIGISAKFQLDFKLNFDWISNFRMNWNTRGALWKVDNDTYFKIENNASDQVGLFQVFSKYHMKCQRLHDFWNHPCCKQHVRWYLVFYMPETDTLSESRLPIDLWHGHSYLGAIHAIKSVWYRFRIISVPHLNIFVGSFKPIRGKDFRLWTNQKPQFQPAS